MKKLVLIGFVLVLLMGFGLVIVNKKPSKNMQNDKKKILTSIYPITYIVKTVGGEKIDVVQIVPNGTEPHEYEPSTENLKSLEAGDVLLINGVLEPWAKDFSKSFEVSTPLMNLKHSDDGVETIDPHVWTNPLNMIKITARITEKLIEIDPENSGYYKNNSSELITELDKLDTGMRNRLAKCETRTIVTSHAAFGYLADRYNLKQLEISGLSTEDEPSAKRIAEIVDIVKKEKLDYVFFESLTSNKLANTIAAETNTKSLELNPIEGLTDEDVRMDRDYISIQNKNLESLVTALKCD